jgi:hypothetical protein
MTPAQFINLWQSNKLTERAGAQPHFDDLCQLLGVEKPRDPDNYCFERGAKKSGGGDGWADVWKRGYFAWENKKPGRDLNKALKQLTDYALQLESPPLLVVCDRERIVIHTAFTGYPDESREIRIEDLVDDGKRQMLRWVFTEPLKLRPEKSTAAVTGEAAQRYAGLAEAMRQRGLDSNQVAHFLVQCLFCMFAEDEGLLPEKIFTHLLAAAKNDVAKGADRITKLFKAMQESKGEYGNDDIEWFNGGLFKQISVPTLTATDLETLRAVSADMDWRAIDPTIFGTLFERGLGTKRAALGAHYTDTATIAKLVEPLVRGPLLLEWQAVREKIAKVASKFGMVKTRGKKFRANDALQQGQALYQGFLLRLADFRVLDPACGSGNFLYLALKALRDVEKLAQVEAQEMGLQAEVSLQTGPHNILGMEINDFAAELARVTVWIGDIQWSRQNGWPHSLNPILKPLDGIKHCDALMNADGSETQWPTSNVIVGNPPFIGDKKMRSELGDVYVETLRKTYAGRVPGGADLVCYWFEKARAQIEAGRLQTAGFVSTSSIRGGINRRVLDRIAESSRIFLAWSEVPWVNDGAAVEVSMTAFGKGEGTSLDGKEVATIHPDLTAGEGVNLTEARPLEENAGTAFSGITKKGSFDIDGPTARALLAAGGNPNGYPNRDVVFPWRNGEAVVARDADKWIVNFGERSQVDASLFIEPFGIVESRVKPQREKSNDKNERTNWWKLARRAPGMFKAVSKLQRFIVTPEVSKHRVFAFMVSQVVPDKNLVVIARDDDATFGILHSRFHEVWALRMGTSLEDRPRYTSTTTFETFPFPEGLTPTDTKVAAPDATAANAVAEAARTLDQFRSKWLNPSEWTHWIITADEQAAGFPKRPIAKLGHEADLKQRTLTNLYNARPAWLTLAHENLDKTVAIAYGWSDYTAQWTDDGILRRLLALNRQRSGK